MTSATLFSGVGAPELAMPEWQWIWHAEIEKFPAAVMAARFPHSVNLGDVTADDFCERALAIGRPDVVVFGSPCQSYSVAGKRLGLDDPRGNLALIALGIVHRLRPAWFVFENVPGLLSSWSGLEASPPECVTEWDSDETSDFAAFLGAVQDIGYFGAWTVLDAQFAGVAQRRERVFFVGHFGDWRGPAAVLLEPESLCGHPPSRQEARQDIAGSITRSLRGQSNATHREDSDTYVPVAPPISLCLNAGGMGRIDAESETLIPTGGFFDGPANALGANAGPCQIEQTYVAEVAPTLNAGGNTTGGDRQPGMSVDTADGLIVAHTLRGVGMYASEDGTGRGTPLVVSHSLDSISAGQCTEDGTSRGTPIVPVLASTQAVAYGFANTAGETQLGHTQEQVPPITTRNGDPGNVYAVALRGREGGGTAELGGEAATALRSSQGGGDKPYVLTTGVRRLTPRECERLQGMPDDHTLITYRGKPAADGPRYKAIGNSMAVPVVRWILTRLEFVHRLQPGDKVKSPKHSEAVA